MLLRFACSNFKSIKDRQEILFTAAKGVKGHEDSLIDVPGSKLKALPVTAIYGPNASGKTSLLEAFYFMYRTILESHTDWKPGAGIPRPYHRLDPACADEVSGFEVDFVHQDVRYQYGFTCTSERFEKEWLYAYPKKLKQVWIERGFQKENWFGPALAGQKEFLQKVVRPNSLAVSACGVANNKQLINIYNYFYSSTSYTGPDLDVKSASARLIFGRNSLIVKNLLHHADVGISKLIIEKGEFNEKKISMPKFVEDYMDSPHRDISDESREITRMLENIEFKIKFLHKGFGGSEVFLDSDEESRGTLRWTEIASQIPFCLAKENVSMIDELETSLHPRLCQVLIQLFMDRRSNPHGAQLIFTSHNTRLLSRDTLRRDSVWLTEKDTEGASHYYPLSDFKIGDKEDIEELYLDGRVGAVPYVGGFEELFERKV